MRAITASRSSRGMNCRVKFSTTTEAFSMTTSCRLPHTSATGVWWVSVSMMLRQRSSMAVELSTPIIRQSGWRIFWRMARLEAPREQPRSYRLLPGDGVAPRQQAGHGDDGGVARDRAPDHVREDPGHTVVEAEQRDTGHGVSGGAVAAVDRSVGVNGVARVGQVSLEWWQLRPLGPGLGPGSGQF